MTPFSKIKMITPLIYILTYTYSVRGSTTTTMGADPNGYCNSNGLTTLGGDPWILSLDPSKTREDNLVVLAILFSESEQVGACLIQLLDATSSYASTACAGYCSGSVGVSVACLSCNILVGLAVTSAVSFTDITGACTADSLQLTQIDIGSITDSCDVKSGCLPYSLLSVSNACRVALQTAIDSNSARCPVECSSLDSQSPPNLNEMCVLCNQSIGVATGGYGLTQYTPSTTLQCSNAELAAVASDGSSDCLTQLASGTSAYETCIGSVIGSTGTCSSNLADPGPISELCPSCLVNHASHSCRVCMFGGGLDTFFTSGLLQGAAGSCVDFTEELSNLVLPSLDWCISTAELTDSGCISGLIGMSGLDCHDCVTSNMMTMTNACDATYCSQQDLDSQSACFLCYMVAGIRTGAECQLETYPITTTSTTETTTTETSTTATMTMESSTTATIAIETLTTQTTTNPVMSTSVATTSSTTPISECSMSDFGNLARINITDLMLSAIHQLEGSHTILLPNTILNAYITSLSLDISHDCVTEYVSGIVNNASACESVCGGADVTSFTCHSCISILGIVALPPVSTTSPSSSAQGVCASATDQFSQLDMANIIACAPSGRSAASQCLTAALSLLGTRDCATCLGSSLPLLGTSCNSYCDPPSSDSTLCQFCAVFAGILAAPRCTFTLCSAEDLGSLGASNMASAFMCILGVQRDIYPYDQMAQCLDLPVDGACLEQLFSIAEPVVPQCTSVCTDFTSPQCNSCILAASVNGLGQPIDANETAVCGSAAAVGGQAGISLSYIGANCGGAPISAIPFCTAISLPGTTQDCSTCIGERSQLSYEQCSETCGLGITVDSPIYCALCTIETSMSAYGYCATTDAATLSAQSSISCGAGDITSIGQTFSVTHSMLDLATCIQTVEDAYIPSPDNSSLSLYHSGITQCFGSSVSETCVRELMSDISAKTSVKCLSLCASDFSSDFCLGCTSINAFKATVNGVDSSAFSGGVCSANEHHPLGLDIFGQSVAGCLQSETFQFCLPHVLGSAMLSPNCKTCITSAFTSAQAAAVAAGCAEVSSGAQLGVCLNIVNLVSQVTLSTCGSSTPAATTSSTTAVTTTTTSTQNVHSTTAAMIHSSIQTTHPSESTIALTTAVSSIGSTATATLTQCGSADIEIAASLNLTQALACVQANTARSITSILLRQCTATSLGHISEACVDQVLVGVSAISGTCVSECSEEISAPACMACTITESIKTTSSVISNVTLSGNCSSAEDMESIAAANALTASTCAASGTNIVPTCVGNEVGFSDACEGCVNAKLTGVVQVCRAVCDGRDTLCEYCYILAGMYAATSCEIEGSPSSAQSSGAHTVGSASATAISGLIAIMLLIKD